MTASTRADEAAGARSLWKRRLAVVVGAVLAAVVVYLVANAVVDGVTGPAMGDRAATDVTVRPVIVTSALASLLGLGLLALLERLTPKGGTIWTVVAVVVLLLSLAGPLSGTGVTTGDRVSLVLMHLAVGAVLIPLLPRGRRP